MKSIKHSKHDIRINKNKQDKIHSSSIVSIIVTGPRHYANRSFIMDVCKKVVSDVVRQRQHKFGHDVCRVKIITGMHSPTCSIARDFAIKNGFEYTQVNFKASYKESGFLNKMKMLRVSREATHVIKFFTPTNPCRKAKRMSKYASLNGVSVYKIPT